MKVYGYIAVEMQNRARLSTSKQEKTVRQYCEQQGLQLKKIFLEELHPGGNCPRNQFYDMLNETLVDGVKVIIVDNFSSLDSNKTVLGSLLAFLSSKDVSVVSCHDNLDDYRYNASLYLNQDLVKIQREFSCFDRQFDNAKRVRTRKKIRELHGKCEGRKSYIEAAPETIREIRRLRRKRAGMKRRTFSEVAQILNAAGNLTISGRKFTGNNVSVIVHRLKFRSMREKKQIGGR